MLSVSDITVVSIDGDTYLGAAEKTEAKTGRIYGLEGFRIPGSIDSEVTAKQLKELLVRNEMEELAYFTIDKGYKTLSRTLSPIEESTFIDLQVKLNQARSKALQYATVSLFAKTNKPEMYIRSRLNDDLT